jgi:hypothetical protein
MVGLCFVQGSNTLDKRAPIANHLQLKLFAKFC